MTQTVPQNQDAELLTRLEAAIIRHAGGLNQFRTDFPLLVRQSLDEVIDAARSGRFTLSELEKTEKTYIGTKIEILLRNHLRMSKGQVLDLLIDGIEVDIKNTIGTNWTIPVEAMGHPCILLKAHEKLSPVCSFGLIVIREDLLNQGRNRDGKRTISQEGLGKVHWLLKDLPYPENFWERLPPQARLEIMNSTGGNERVASLFRTVQRTPISRETVQAVAQQSDYMKRIRRNGGARDILAREGIAILWGGNDQVLIQHLGLQACNRNFFISVKADEREHIRLLKTSGHID